MGGGVLFVVPPCLCRDSRFVKARRQRFVCCSYLAPLCGGGEDLVWYLEDQCGLSISCGTPALPTATRPRRCRPREKRHRRQTQQAGGVQSRPDGDRLLGSVDGGRRCIREGRGSKIGSEVFSSRLVLWCPLFHFPFGSKAFSYGHGTLTPPPAGMFSSPRVFL